MLDMIEFKCHHCGGILVSSIFILLFFSVLIECYFKTIQEKEKVLTFVVDDELFNATKEGDIEKVKLALESGVSQDARFIGGSDEPLLSIAAKVFKLIFFSP